MTSEEEAIRMHAQQIGTEHILLAIIKEKDCIALRLMKGMNINLKKIYVDVLVATGVDSTRAQKEFQSLTAPKKAKKKKQLEIARNMKAKGFAAEDISELTGLPVKEIKEL